MADPFRGRIGISQVGNDRAGPAPLTATLVREGGSHEAVRLMLEEAEIGVEICDQVADLRESSQSLIVICVDGTPTRALGRALDGVRGQVGETPVVVVCAEVRPGELRTALAAGADGVVLASELGTALIPGLAAVCAGLVCVPRRHARQVEPAALSIREKQILGLVVMGYMNSQIAEQLFVAESTVKSHLSSAFSKLGVRSRNEAVELILDTDRGLGMGILALGGEPLQRSGPAYSGG